MKAPRRTTHRAFAHRSSRLERGRPIGYIGAIHWPGAADVTDATTAATRAGLLSHRRLLLRFWADFLRPRARIIVFALILSAVEGATLGLLSWMVKPLFDQVFGARAAHALVWIGLAILALFLLRAVTSILGRWLLARVNQESTADMQKAILGHLLMLDLAFFHANAPGALIERVQGDSASAQGAVMLVIVGFARDAISLIGLSVVALSIDWRWTLAALAGTPLLGLPVLGLQRYIRRKSRASRVEASLRATRLDEIFHGIRQIKLQRIESFQSARFARTADRLARAEVKSALGRATIPALVDVITGIGFFAVLLLGGREVIDGTRTTGDFMAFFAAMALTFQPLRRLSDLAGQRQVALAALERTYALIDARPEGAARPDRSRAYPLILPPAIRFEDVRFAYAGGGPLALDRLSFDAEAGRVTALVGPSGSGKSTVFHLLTGLADPQDGRVLIGGASVTDMTLDDQRRLFAVVSQDTALFDETLRDNILLGRAGIGPEAFERAVRDSQVGEFIPRMAHGLDTMAGPRGSALSGGQRQRIAIARALLADASVLLLDEATSALDSASEQAVIAALDRAGSGRTTLVIAHRLATVRNADHIVVLDHGHVAERGTHDQLLARGGLYARLHALQVQDSRQH